MVKPASLRQKEYEARQKAKDKEAQLKKRREQKQKQRAAFKANEENYEIYKAKDRMTIRVPFGLSATPALNSSYTTRQCLGKAVSCVSNSLPKTTVKKKQIITHTIASFLPASKEEIFASARKERRC